MERKNDVNKIDLKVDEVRAFKNKSNQGIIISWSSTIGFGEYTLVFNPEGKITGDSERMDDGENKDFLRKLLSLLADQTTVR